MSIITIKNKTSFECYPDSMISFGKVLNDGFYFCFRSPYTITRTGPDPIDFHIKSGTWKKHYLMRIRLGKPAPFLFTSAYLLIKGDIVANWKNND